jgi:hypothetical protein
MDDKRLAGDIGTFIRAVLLSLALQVLRSVSGSIPGAEQALAGVRLSEWLFAFLTLALGGVLISAYGPLCALASFYLGALVRGARVPGRERHLPQVARLAQRLVLLGYLIALFQLLAPAVERLAPALPGFAGLKILVQATAFLVGLAILALIWHDTSALIDVLTERIARGATAVSLTLAYARCRACNSRNDRDAEFCTTCGAVIVHGTDEAARTRSCGSCGAANDDKARFCLSCGQALAEPGVTVAKAAGSPAQK